MTYQMTPLEEKIRDIYLYAGLTSPSNSIMHDFANHYDIWLHKYDGESRAIKRRGLYSIFLNKNISLQEQWQDFGHEMGHVIKHVGDQHAIGLSFRELQEFQANNFMYQFCVPTFMLLKYEQGNLSNTINGVDFVSEKFNVTRSFAKIRIDHYKNQWLLAHSDAEHRRLMKKRIRKAGPYMPETLDVLNKLDVILKKRKELSNA